MAKSKQMSLFTKMFTSGRKWEDKDEFLDIIYWGRQVFAIIIGLIWGFMGFTGSMAILAYIAINCGIVFTYSSYINEEQEDATTAVKEGFLTAFASFLVSWIILYSALYS